MCLLHAGVAARDSHLQHRHHCLQHVQPVFTGTAGHPACSQLVLVPQPSLSGSHATNAHRHRKHDRLHLTSLHAQCCCSWCRGVQLACISLSGDTTCTTADPAVLYCTPWRHIRLDHGTMSVTEAIVAHLTLVWLYCGKTYLCCAGVCKDGGAGSRAHSHHLHSPGLSPLQV